MPMFGFCRHIYSNLCPCFICCKKFSLDNGLEDLLTHICFTHRIIIENIDCVADFKEYMEYYAKLYRQVPLETFTKSTVMEVPQINGEIREQKYYFLGDFLEDDKNLRKALHSKRLKAAEKQHKNDHNGQCYLRHCFYCHQTIEVTNEELINHLRMHGFHLGHPDKLVYIERFIEAIEDNFRNLHCFYCEKKFDSSRALIRHMRVKNHQKIHPNNRFYDQFYMINYIEFGKTWMDFIKKNHVEPEEEVEIDEDSDWSSWGTEPESITCLFCKHICRSWDGTLLHMQVSHNFDFKTEMSHFDFYNQIKIVNYIRRRVLNNKCINCDFESDKDIVAHMEKNNHLFIPDKGIWNHSDYYFCSMENDMLLHHLEDKEIDENENNRTTKESSAILRHIDIGNTDSESSDSIGSDFCLTNYPKNTFESIKNDMDNKIIESANRVEIKIKHLEGVSYLTPSHQLECSSEEEIVDHKRKKFTESVAHVGAGDSGYSFIRCDDTMPVSDFGDVGSKTNI